MPSDRRFVVVEQAGYEGERDVKSFPSCPEAWRHIERAYSAAERDPFHPDCLNVDVRLDWTDQQGNSHSTYEC